MSTDVQLLLDEMSNVINYGGGKWSVHTDIRWVGGTCIWPQFADGTIGATGTFGTLDLSFQGTGIAFFGNTPPLPQSQNVTVSIDGGASYNTTYTTPHDYIQWYQSPVLVDGTHKIAMEGIEGTALDFAVITLGTRTALDAGLKIIVDDDNPEIEYAGRWIRSGDPLVISEGPNGRPFHNGTHQSSTPGDTATFRFAGTSIAVYGIFSWAKTGNLSVQYTLDSVPTAQTYSVAPTTPEYVKGLRQHPNHLMFFNDSIPAGNHSLVMKITQADGLTFSVDYLTYRPSFSSVDLKPVLTGTSPAPSSTASKKVTIGGIVGAVIGALVFISVIVGVLFIPQRRRRQKEVAESATIVPWDPSYKPSRLPRLRHITDLPYASTEFEPAMVQRPSDSRATDVTTPGDSSPVPLGHSRLTPEPAPAIPDSQRKHRLEQAGGASAPLAPPAVPEPPRKYRLEWVNTEPTPALGETSSHQLTRPLGATSFLLPTPPRGAMPSPLSTPPLPPPAPPSSSLGSTPSSETTLLTPRQREIQRRMRELASLMAVQSSPQGDEAATGEAGIQIAQLRQRVDELVRENAILGGAPPPAYEPTS